EYVEGTSNNKALEIWNAGTTAVDLASCALHRYTNGSATPFVVGVFAASFLLQPDQTFVICHSLISDSSSCDTQTSALNHNGNDAYELVCGNVAQDVFGQIGYDPQTAWTDGSGSVTTLDMTLRRKCSVVSGDPNGSDAFD